MIYDLGWIRWSRYLNAVHCRRVVASVSDATLSESEWIWVKLSGIEWNCIVIIHFCSNSLKFVQFHSNLFNFARYRVLLSKTNEWLLEWVYTQRLARKMAGPACEPLDLLTFRRWRAEEGLHWRIHLGLRLGWHYGFANSIQVAVCPVI